MGKKSPKYARSRIADGSAQINGVNINANEAPDNINLLSFWLSLLNFLRYNDRLYMIAITKMDITGFEF